MKIKSILLPLFFIAAFTSGIYSQNPTQTKESAQTQIREVSGFTAVSLNIPAAVTLTQGNFSFDINCSPGLLGKIKTEVHGNELEINFENWQHTHIDEPISIHISMPSVEGLEVNGSGSISAQSSFTGDNMRLEINGSGKMNIPNFSCNNLKAEINGSGSISNLSGTASTAKFEINGSGHIDAENLIAKSVDAAVTGSGNMRLNVSDLLNADITGSGDIRYKGTPKKNVDITGSGSVSTL